LVGVLRQLAGRQRPVPELSGSRLTAALCRLRAADREVLMLTAWEGLGVSEAAVVLGCTPQAVHTRWHRARARLRAELNRDIPEVSIA
jgi:RNA polymerase sigma-70 factor (ECF subfamily)